MKIASIVGARPQFIKLNPVSKKLRKYHDEILIHTGQHYNFELSKLFFEELGIPEPDFNLGIGSGTHGKQTGEMIIEIEKVLLEEKPDFTIVFGDTNSTLAGALASVKLQIPVGHVEAGLRSFDRSMPEEINRILTDHASDVLFIPTKTAYDNLKNEGITGELIFSGDVMYDVLSDNIELSRKSKILEKFGIEANNYYLATIHRQSNTDDPNNLLNIIKALSKLDKKVLFPIHPRTLKFIKKYDYMSNLGKNILLIDPVGYLDFLWLEKNAKKILTDSGGIQKEAFIFKIPCITLRENTEWIETVEDKWNVLVGTNIDKIVNAVNNFSPSHMQSNHFGDGNASVKIVDAIGKYLTKK